MHRFCTNPPIPNKAYHEKFLPPHNNFTIDSTGNLVPHEPFAGEQLDIEDVLNQSDYHEDD